jgi:glycosyltransferase involved in cell wall biosynthesis
MKKGVLFVGSFMKEAKDGHVGGQMFACNSLLNSKISDNYNWFLVDSTSESVFTPSFLNRVSKAFKRIFKCLSILVGNGSKVDTLLIFTVDGFSFIEKGSILLLGKLFGKRTIIAPRSGLFPNNFKRPLFKWFIKLVFNKADWIVCQGQSWKDFFLAEINSLNSDKLIIINNWINPELYADRIKYIPTEKIIITYIGWFEEFKGVQDLIQVIDLINSNSDLGSQVEFRLAGMGSKFQEISSQVNSKRYNNVILLGWVKNEEKTKLLKDTDIYLQLSHVEGFPNSILEAMASGKAVLCTNVGAVSDLVNDGVNGFTVPPHNPAEAYKKLLVLIEDQSFRLTMAKNAEETVRDRFVLEKAVEKFNIILSENPTCAE